MIDKAKKYLHHIQAKNKQKAITKEYLEHGLSERVLEEQVKLYVFRNLHDIPDETTVVYEKFVQ